MRLTYLLTTLLILQCAHLSAQFSYSKRKPQPLSKSSTTSGGNLNFEPSEYLEEKKKMDRFLELTKSDYEKIKKLTLGKTDEALLAFLDSLPVRSKTIYIIHENSSRLAIQKAEITTNFRRTNENQSQFLAGLTLSNNDLEKTNTMLELGGKINNTRISLSSKLKYRYEEADSNKLNVTRVQKDRYLYFDFISRGLLSFDDLKRTVSEYISSTLGSPVSVRLNLQQKLSRPEIHQDVTGRREPITFLNFDLDARAIPVINDTKIDNFGGSFHFITHLFGVFPSGSVVSDKQEDTFIIQLSLNMAYVTDDVKKSILLASGDNTLKNNFFTSVELRVGNVSDIEPLRNWSLFAKYTGENILGNRFTLGFSFAPKSKSD